MQCKLVFQASVADSHLSFVWRVNFNWSWLICLYFGNRASPLASATASEPRVVWLFKFLNWPSFSNLSTRMRITQVAMNWQWIGNELAMNLQWMCNECAMSLQWIGNYRRVLILEEPENVKYDEVSLTVCVFCVSQCHVNTQSIYSQFTKGTQ